MEFSYQRVQFSSVTHSCPTLCSNIICMHQAPETPQRLTELCLGVSWGGMGQRWPAAGAEALGAADLGWHKPSWRSPLTQDRAMRTDTGLGNRPWEGTDRTLCAGPRRKRLTQTCPRVSRSLWRRRGSAVACCRVRGPECSSACMGPLKEVTLPSLPPQ